MENNWKWYEQQNPQQNAQQSEQPQQQSQPEAAARRQPKAPAPCKNPVASYDVVPFLSFF